MGNVIKLPTRRPHRWPTPPSWRRKPAGRGLYSLVSLPCHQGRSRGLKKKGRRPARARRAPAGVRESPSLSCRLNSFPGRKMASDSDDGGMAALLSQLEGLLAAAAPRPAPPTPTGLLSLAGGAASHLVRKQESGPHRPGGLLGGKQRGVPSSPEGVSALPGRELLLPPPLILCLGRPPSLRLSRLALASPGPCPPQASRPACCYLFPPLPLHVPP